ncbi:AAA family ATPase [Collimonas fungivorans]|uniref:AAA family ATPase n=1 Tax=Collimonas fungivorans TaxID=158899 RepID=UPI003FA3A735
MVIRRALAACDKTIILSYTKPEFDGCDRATRETWIRSLFPSATVLVLDDESLRSLCAKQRLPFRVIPPNDAADEIQREFVGWLCWDLLHLTVDAVFTSEDYGDGFAVALSAYFSTRRKTAASVQHVCVDQARHAIPISGTVIRTDPHRHREFLSPAVYASFVKRICFLGGESSGKTTLAEALARQLSTSWVAEYGRELWEQKDGKLEFDDMLEIGRMQLSRENAQSQQAHRLLVCDTSPLTTLFYSIAMFGRACSELQELASRHYHFVFLCAPDFPFVQDGTRQDDSFRLQQHAWYLEQLQQRSIPFTVLSGLPRTRLDAALAVLTAPVVKWRFT